MSIQTTSTQSYTSASASTPRDIQQAMTEASLPTPQAPPHGPPKEGWVEKLAVPIMGMILAAVVTYFSTIIAVKDDIATNRQDVSLLKSDLSHVDEKIADLKEDIHIVKNINSELVVLKTRLEILESRAR